MRLQHFTVELHNIRDPVMVHLWSQMHMVIIHMQAWVMCDVLVVESFGGSVISGEYVIDVSYRFRNRFDFAFLVLVSKMNYMTVRSCVLILCC